MSRLTVGMRVWVHHYHRHGAAPTMRTVAKVGRLWATLDNGDRAALAPHRGCHHLDGDSWGAHAYTDAQLAVDEHAVTLYQLRRSVIRLMEGEDVAPENILTICRLLGIDTPDALPSEAEVLARFGAVPLTSDRSIE